MLRVRVLGGLALELDGESLDPPAGRRARTLLAWLALHPGRHPRSRVAARLWPDVLESSARASLRTTLHELRRDLGGGAGCLAATREHVALEGDRLWVDVRAVEGLAAAGRAAEALELCRGELPAELDGEWGDEARERHRERVVGLLEGLAAAAEATGDQAAALRRTREQVELDPLSEELHRRLIRRLHEGGDRAAALTAYERLAERLRTQLGVAPSGATRALAERVRAEAEAPSGGPASGGPPPGGLPAGQPLPALLARRRPGPFVGRGPALERLRACLAAAGAGERRLAVVGGEPGIGKTRLVTELCRAAHDEGATVLFGRCFEETLVPYQPFVEALGELPAADAADADPEGARWRLFEAVDALLAATAARAPVVLALDDLHWADSGTLLLLAHLARSPEPAALLLLGTYRTGELDRAHPLSAVLADLRRELPVERLTLDGLDRAAVGDLAAGWIDRGAPADVVAALHDETAGNPFFVEELLRNYAESGALRPLPEGVKDVIGRRLARLGESATRVLSAAAVAGGDVDLEVLEALGGLESDDALRALEDGVAAQMLREAPGRAGRYDFAHALIRETLYDDLSAARRARLHGALAAALETVHAGALEPHLGELAHHLLEAGDPRAVDAAAQAARAATAQLAYEEAAAWYERALDALGREPGASEPRRCELLLALGAARQRAGEASAARECFTAAAAGARALGDPDLLGRAALGVSGFGVTIIGVDEQSVRLLEEAIAAAPTEGALASRLVGRLAVETYYAAVPERRKELGDRAVALARRAGGDAVLFDALNARHVALWSAAFLDERLTTALEMIALAERAGDQERAIQGHNWRVLDLAELGDVEGMRREIARHEELAERLRLPAYAWWGPMWRSTLAVLEGRLDDAERLVAEFRAIGARAEDPNAALYADVQTNTIAIERGAVHTIGSAMLDRQAGMPADPAYRSGYAWIFAAQGRRAEARELLDWVCADDLARLPEDMNRLAALCELTQASAVLGDARHAAAIHAHLAPYAARNVINARAAAGYGCAAHHLGVLAALLGREDEAAAHFDEALRRHEAMGARLWLERTRAQLARLPGASAAARRPPRSAAPRASR